MEGSSHTVGTASYMGASSGNAKQFGYFLLEMALTDFTIISVVCFSLAAKYDTANFFSGVSLLGAE